MRIMGLGTIVHKDFEEAVERYKTYSDFEHQILDKEVSHLHNTYQPDHVIKAAKLNKLHLKQEIETIKDNLSAMIK